LSCENLLLCHVSDGNCGKRCCCPSVNETESINPFEGHHGLAKLFVWYYSFPDPAVKRGSVFWYFCVAFMWMEEHHPGIAEQKQHIMKTIPCEMMAEFIMVVFL
jgi:hypothetical protein